MADTRFKPGQSGNPGGMPKGFWKFRASAAVHSPEMIDFWLQVVRSPKASLMARMRASENLAAYGVGKPPTATEGAGDSATETLHGALVIKRRRADGSIEERKIPTQGAVDDEQKAPEPDEERGDPEGA